MEDDHSRAPVTPTPGTTPAAADGASAPAEPLGEGEPVGWGRAIVAAVCGNAAAVMALFPLLLVLLLVAGIAGGFDAVFDLFSNAQTAGDAIKAISGGLLVILVIILVASALTIPLAAAVYVLMVRLLARAQVSFPRALLAAAAGWAAAMGGAVVDVLLIGITLGVFSFAAGVGVAAFVLHDQ